MEATVRPHGFHVEFIRPSLTFRPGVIVASGQDEKVSGIGNPGRESGESLICQFYNNVQGLDKSCVF